jgi:hypothetical protein
MTTARGGRSVRHVDETSAPRQLPEPYALALRLRAEGLDSAQIAAKLELEPEAMESLLRIAEANQAALDHAAQSTV